MNDKFSYYDLLSMLVPGTLLVGTVPFLFPTITSIVSHPAFPDAFAVVILTALAVFLGQAVQAVASLIEPLLYWSWGGRPSDRALKEGIPHYLPDDSAKRIKGKLQQWVAGDASDHALFLFAMQQADGADAGRARLFNSVYAYHRGLVVLLVIVLGLLVLSLRWGRLTTWNWELQVAAFVAIGLLTVLMWHRARQRANYYVREVLHVAERVFEAKKKE
jgi:hypothetical protein